MNNYNIVVWTEKEKYEVIDDIKAVGAVLLGVSGYYEGYYIELKATPDQVFLLNKKLGGAA